MKKAIMCFVALLAIAAAAGPVRGQNSYNVTFGGFYNSDMNITVSVLSLPQTFTEIDGYSFQPWQVLNDESGSEFTSVSVTSDGNGKVSANMVDWSEMTITVSGPFEGTATIHVEGHDNNENPLSRDITVSCVAPPVPITVRMAAGTEEAANWTLASGNASVPGTQVLEGIMSGSQLTATYAGDLKVKEVIATKHVPPVLVQSIVLDKQTAFLAKDSTMTLSVASVLPENAADKSYTWSSDDITKATVDQNGVVTGKAAGTANIIATANDGSGVTATCVVTVLNSVILDGVTVFYASDNDRWSTITGYNPGVLYLDGDYVRLTSNGASLFYDGDVVHSIDFIYSTIDVYQWLRVTNISNLDFYYHQGETWQQAISANRSYNHDWYIDGGQVKYMMQTLVDTDSQPIDPTATIDPSTVNYHLD